MGILALVKRIPVTPDPSIPTARTKVDCQYYQLVRHTAPMVPGQAEILMLLAMRQILNHSRQQNNR